MDNTSAFLGNWRIIETELWELEDLDLATPAILKLSRNHDGYIAFIALEAEVDYRVVVRDGRPAIEFSFDGFDECDRVAGRGWAVLEDDCLRGRLFFHQGDDSAFVARQKGTRRPRRVPANRALHPTAAQES
jgi:hypothetical protein